jgi:hypothetical protein
VQWIQLAHDMRVIQMKPVGGAASEYAPTWTNAGVSRGESVQTGPARSRLVPSANEFRLNPHTVE